MDFTCPPRRVPNPVGASLVKAAEESTRRCPYVAGSSEALSDMATSLARLRLDPTRTGQLEPNSSVVKSPSIWLLGPPTSQIQSMGVGKSTQFNAIAGAPLSESGLIRPTTRRPVALAHPTDSPSVGEAPPSPGHPKGIVRH